MYRKLKRTWSHNDLNYIPKFKELFPELRLVDNEELADRFIDLGLDFYTEVKTPVKFITRLTLPFGLLIVNSLILKVQGSVNEYVNPCPLVINVRIKKTKNNIIFLRLIIDFLFISYT
jgi:hypothetical protein